MVDVALIISLVQQPLARRRLGTLNDLDLGVGEVYQHLPKIAHIEPLCAAGHFMN
jgi:hypothetical protein